MGNTLVKQPRWVALDERGNPLWSSNDEGGDMVFYKPAMKHLDVCRIVAETDVPILPIVVDENWITWLHGSTPQ